MSKQALKSYVEALKALVAILLVSILTVLFGLLVRQCTWGNKCVKTSQNVYQAEEVLVKEIGLLQKAED